MKQYYIVEITQNANDEYEHQVHWAYDQNAEKARLKAESAFYTILSNAAISETKSHSAILFDADGYTLMNRCYKHDLTPQA